MFYYLLYNSSFEFISSNRLFSTILYGSILYIISHAILNYCNVEVLGIIKNYFWIIFTLDIISFSWSLYQLLTLQPNNASSGSANGSANGSPEDLTVSFNLLKNKISTLFDRNKNNLTITANEQPQSAGPIRIAHSQYGSSNITSSNITPPNAAPANNSSGMSISNQSISSSSSASVTGNYSTPISQLHRQPNSPSSSSLNIPEYPSITTPQHSQPSGNGSSTPISLLREKINIPEVNIQENNYNGDNFTESVAGSDVANVMDLEDFEKSL